MSELITLEDLTALEEVLKSSAEKDVLIFKHSAT
ncbi:hypothetical protein DealDRAFT_1904 [Dethiobacter alkaliphilus AHT 1]|uniref:Uncharacterized protein n=1 Tax=Dethiobacter alkaliphilus AHT 1 TaxID=555088 RepID=C0GHE5_DETAL|nr:hypothetical protein DealDRAFT_1904 [Dethiobacter alkaliphilus AHT 1]